MTEQEAIAKGDTGWWKTATADEIVRFQLFEERLCMPFGDFHSAVEASLGHPVWTHEFASPGHLKDEFLAKKGN